jgi:hypothetical protein
MCLCMEFLSSNINYFPELDRPSLYIFIAKFVLLIQGMYVNNLFFVETVEASEFVEGKKNQLTISVSL